MSSSDLRPCGSSVYPGKGQGESLPDQFWRAQRVARPERQCGQKLWTELPGCVVQGQ